MRYWSRPFDPTKSQPRTRTSVKTPHLATMGDQRPMFSDPNDEEANQKARLLDRMAPEAQMDSVVPTDRGPGGVDEPEREGSDLESDSVFVKYADPNVSPIPTSAEFDTAFGILNKQNGFIGVISDSGGDPTYIVTSNGLNWYWVRLTKAV